MVKMRPNLAKRKLAGGGVVTVAMGLNSADMIDSMGPFGFDMMWLEGEHGQVDFGDVGNLSRACELWGMTALARLHQNEYGLIYRMLDVGAHGVVIPHVNTADEARAAVRAAKYHPIGMRGTWKSRTGYGVENYRSVANDETMVVVLIEDIIAIENLQEILTVDHIDAFLVAPGDLGQSMGHVDPDHPDVTAVRIQAIRDIVAAGRVAGTTASEASIDEAVDAGARLIATGWHSWLEAGARSFLDQVAELNEQVGGREA